MIFSLHYIDTAVQCKDSHLIQFVSILFRICLTECYQLIIDEYRKLQLRTELLLEFRVCCHQTLQRFSLIFQYKEQFSCLLLHQII